VSDRSALRLFVLRVLVVSILATLLGRLWFLQVYAGDTYTRAATDNRIREVVEPATRGQVFDSAGRVVVGNRTAMVVSVNRALVRKEPGRGAEVLARLSKVIGLPVEEIVRRTTPCGDKLPDGTPATSKTDCWNGSPYQPVPVREYATDDPKQVRPVLLLEEHPEQYPGVTAELQAVRTYPQARTAVHLLGHLGPITPDEVTQARFAGYAVNARIGRGGVEQSYETPLHGVDGVQQLIVDKDGSVTGEKATTPPVPGDDLVLSLDSGVQKLAEAALERGVMKARRTVDRERGTRYKAPTGAVVVMEAATGRLAAMASYPSYDPNVFDNSKAYAALLEDKATPLVSNATQGTFSPGSTFKIVSTSAAVASGANLHGTYNCPPNLKIGNRTFRNFEGEQFGNIDFRTALIKSCDTVYYQLGYDEWVRDGGTTNIARAREVFANTARQFGFGSETGIDLPEERSGLITDRGFKQRNWDKYKDDYCKGAKNPAFSDYRRAIDAENCTDGYRYNAGDAVNFSIGQGDVLSTPLQLAAAYGALANGGTLYEPRVAKALLSADGTRVTPIPPVVKGKLKTSKETLAYIRSALAEVTAKGGTAQNAYAGFPQGSLSVAGKTGTAEVNAKQPTSWFASFAPVDKPRYVVVALVTEGGTGGTTAAPITREIYDGLYGLEGKKALLTNGALPSGLPVVRPDGTVGPPGTKLTGPAPKVVPLPTPTPSGSPALFTPSPLAPSPLAPSLLALGPVYADVPDRRRWSAGLLGGSS
jgi:penicillin-binding protein 2